MDKIVQNRVEIDLAAPEESLRDVFLKEQTLIFKKPVLVYLPCYNCAKKIAQTLAEIPAELHDKIECLIIDNQSEDGTIEVVLNEINSKQYPFKINVIQPKENIGFAGSQKLAYYIASSSPDVEHIMVLHGDGQYPPVLLKEFIPFLKKDYALVNGQRSKRAYPQKEETPIVTYMIIKFLSILESFLLGFPKNEWHSGFVMYRKDFLQKIPLQYLSSWMHIDGEFIMCAGVLKEKTASIPIYKRYKGFDMFAGVGRMKYVTHVFRLIARFKRKEYHQFLKAGHKTEVNYAFDIINSK